jgi:L-ascorbate metabolism protein UlaG (beta-lactamase superfamily)
MEITWLGHSSFLIVDSLGKKIITDPFDNSVGYDLYQDNADIVTISHHHFDHDYLGSIKGNPKVFDKAGHYNVNGITIEGIPSYHDKIQGSKRGDNIIFIITMDGYRLCHLGDLGHLLSKRDLEKLNDIDVLFIPVGGNFTINSEEASIVAKSINSHIIIPMHYKTEKVKFPLEGLENFITYMKSGEKINSTTLQILSKSESTNVVKLLDY